MPQHLLHPAEVGTTREEMCGGGVPQPVRGNVDDASEACEVMDDLANLSLPPTLSPRAKEQRLLRGVGDEHRATALKPCVDGAASRKTKRDNAFARPLAEDTHGALGELNICDINSDELPHTNPRRVEEFDGGPVTQVCRVAALGPRARSFHERARRVDIKNVGKHAVGAGARKPGRRIVLKVPCAASPLKKGTDRCTAARECCAGEIALAHVGKPGTQESKIDIGRPLESAPGRVGGQLLNVAPVGPDSVRGEPPLDPEVDAEAGERFVPPTRRLCL